MRCTNSKLWCQQRRSIIGDWKVEEIVKIWRQIVHNLVIHTQVIGHTNASEYPSICWHMWDTHSDLLIGFVEAGTQSYRWTQASREEKAKAQTFTSDPKVKGWHKIQGWSVSRLHYHFLCRSPDMWCQPIFFWLIALICPVLAVFACARNSHQHNIL